MIDDVYVNPFYIEFFQDTSFENILAGGRGAGKSYSVADKILLYNIQNRNAGNYNPLKVLVIRKSYTSLVTTCVEIIGSEAKKLGFNYHYDAQNHIGYVDNMKIIFRSLNNQEDFNKIKSITDLDLMWIEEATEIRQQDYENIIFCLRGGKGIYKQSILSFNPFPKSNWIYKNFYTRKVDNCKLFTFTVDHNPFVENSFKKRLDNLREQNPELYKVFRLGQWGEMEGIIYEWDVCQLPDIQFDEVFYGLDFGYSVDPAALVKVYRKADEYWVREEIYQTGLTNRDLSRKFYDCGLRLTDKQEIYADCAEPKSIDELCQDGWNLIPCDKGQDSIRHGIDTLKALKIHIIEGSENIQKEKDSYIWKKDKNGNSLNVPVDFDNHALDAIRYAIVTHINNYVKPNQSIGITTYKEQFTY